MKRFYHHGRCISVYCVDHLTWRVMIDSSPLYRKGKRCGFWSRREAQTAGFEFVNKIAFDEGVLL